PLLVLAAHFVSLAGIVPARPRFAKPATPVVRSSAMPSRSLFDDGDRATPAATAAVNLHGEACDLEARRSGNRAEVGHLLDVAVLAIPPRVVGREERPAIAGAQPLDHGGNGDVESPAVGAHHPDALVDQVQGRGA